MEKAIDRRRLISLLAAGTAMGSCSIPRAGWAQAASGKLKRVGVMMAIAANDPEGLGRIDVFRRALLEAGWTDGRNVTIDYRWADGHYDRLPAFAAEFVSRKVDVILATA